MENQNRVSLSVVEDLYVKPDVEFLEHLKVVPGVIGIDFIPMDESSYLLKDSNMLSDITHMEVLA